MEYTPPLDQSIGAEMGINSEIKNYLKETAKWGNLLAIMSFIMMTLAILAIVGMGILLLQSFQLNWEYLAVWA